MFRSLHILSIVAAVQNSIPSDSFYHSSALSEHPALMASQPGSLLFKKYVSSLANSLKSVQNLDISSEFHMDSLVFALANTKRVVDALRQKFPYANDQPMDMRISFAEYEKLISVASSLGLPSIHPKNSMANLLDQKNKEFYDNNDIIYVDDIFDDITIAKLQSEVFRLWGSSDIEANCNLDGINRVGGYVHFTSTRDALEQADSLYSLIYGNEPLRLWMSAVTGKVIFPADFPIELREYGENSKGMPCHADTQMYADASEDFEVVVTLSNKGECQIYWYDRNNVKRTIWPSPNSITIVRANAAVHCVSETLGGSREILKFIMVGNHKKHRHFFQYTENNCESDNPNRMLLQARKLSVGVSEFSDEL